MTNDSVFNAKEEYYKKPFGAVAVGERVRLRVLPPADGGFVRCAMLGYLDFAAAYVGYDMADDGNGTFSLDFTAPETADLLWYYFRFERSDGQAIFWGTDGGTDIPNPNAFQLTVYDTASTPEWFGNGITYQIFPDRFFRTVLPNPQGMVGDRWIHENWYDAPAYAPENGEITNRDFFGGNLNGIAEKLDYLASLSVSTIYLNPIFEAASNHRYDTADYSRIDPMLGDENDFKRLCIAAKERGIRIILDGVFNHTGNNSRYFNAKGFYPCSGAAQSPDSAYFPWYTFSKYPEEYSAWWGIKTLPQVNESAPSYLDYIIENQDSIVRHWLRAGASGWRLDVADELPDSFIARLRAAATEEKSDAIIIGEVWEDGSNKIAYNTRRRYLLGSETHGLMNYPFRTSVISYLKGGNAADFKNTMETIREHYPPAAFYSAMSSLGTHDTPRLITFLGQNEDLSSKSRDFRANYSLTAEEHTRGEKLVKLATIILYAFPGSPTLFYGDEIGLEGCEDPFNRRPYPWGKENVSLLSHFKNLGRARKTSVCLQRGDIQYIKAEGNILIFSRTLGSDTAIAAINTGEVPYTLDLPWNKALAQDCATLQHFIVQNGKLHITLLPLDGVLLL